VAREARFGGEIAALVSEKGPERITAAIWPVLA
jgi:hypothetical protein